MTEDNKIRDAADAVTDLVKAVPVYNALAQPAVREVDAVAGRTVRVLLAPVTALVWSVRRSKRRSTKLLPLRLLLLHGLLTFPRDTARFTR
jgi:hypothetical protein